MELAVKQVEMLMKYKQEGKILAGGTMTGRRGSYAIWNVGSVEELQKLKGQLLMFAFGENKVKMYLSTQMNFYYGLTNMPIFVHW